MTVIDQNLLRDKLEELSLEHRDLDDVIHRLYLVGAIEQMQMQRLKKRKLRLKEQIVEIKNKLIPDIIA